MNKITKRRWPRSYRKLGVINVAVTMVQCFSLDFGAILCLLGEVLDHIIYTKVIEL
jgi:hypothetical protein